MEQGIEMDRGSSHEDNRPTLACAFGDIVLDFNWHRGFLQNYVAEDRRPGSAADRRIGIPRVTFCEPEIASVGLTQKQAGAVRKTRSRLGIQLVTANLQF